MEGPMSAAMAILEPKIDCDDLVPSALVGRDHNVMDGNANIVIDEPSAKCEPDCDTSTVRGHKGIFKTSPAENKDVNGACSKNSFCRNNGFEILSSFENDSFDCDGEGDSNMPEQGSDQGSGKRNRQISTDSNGSMAVESKSKIKSKKKLKRNCRGTQQMNDDIDKIIMELDGRSPPTATPDDDTLVETKSTKEKKKRPKSVKKDITMTEAGDGIPVAAAPPSDSDKKTKSKTIKDVQVVRENSGDASKEDPPLETVSAKGRKRPGKKVLAVIHAALRKAKEDEERLLQEELAKQRKVEEAEKLRLEQLKLEQERKERKKQKEKDRKQRLKSEGKFLTKSQRVAKARGQAALTAWRQHGIDVPNVVGDNEFQKKPISRSISNEDDKTDMKISNRKNNYTFSPRQRHMTEPASEHPFEDSTNDSPTVSNANRREETRPRTRAKSESDVTCETQELSRKSRCKSSKMLLEWNPESSSIYRSPVVCVLGHVDTGKTKILDKIRKTNIQDNEAGGITQQIGATMFPREALQEKCGMVKSFKNFDLQLPGLLIIDTPGHESFKNMRSRGSSLCDIAILVVDIMHGIENQTIESINLLKKRRTPFIVALNKIDRLYGWKSDASSDVEEVIKGQDNITFMEFDKRVKQVIAEFANHSLNATLFYENKDARTYVSLIPVSAVSGDGMGNLLAVITQLCQNIMAKQLKFSDELEATVLEVKVAAGLGTTIDVILVNGELKETDTIVLVGQEGPIVTQIRSLLMPQPLRELRVKNPYREFKTVKGAQGIKITGKDLDKAIAGLPLFVPRSPDEVPLLKDKAVRILRNTINSIKLSERGVYVQASTLGSLEALLNFLKSSGVPYSGVKVGPVVKKDVMKASVMLEHDIQFAVILAFDVKIEKDAQEIADHLGIKIFHADIIYHLFDNFTAFRDELHDKKMVELKKNMVFPCKLSVLPDSVSNMRNPIVIGVHVVAGLLKIGTPLCVPSKNFVELGTVTHIESQQHSVERAKEGDEVCIKIEPASEEAPKIFGKHLDDSDLLVSKITRQSIDVCKEFCRDELQKSDWNLMVELKRILNIV